jgi:hypothetical protein
MEQTIDTVKQTAAMVDSVLQHFNNASLPSSLRPGLIDIINMFHTAMQVDILNILIPIVRRMGLRIKKGDVKFFSSKEFIEKITEAVRTRCDEVIKQGKMPEKVRKEVEPRMKPILLAIQNEAQMYLSNDQAPFEEFLELATSLLDFLDQL